MDILEIFKTIKEDWPLLVFTFTLASAWWQGQAWFKKLTDTLESVGRVHDDQNESLSSISNKIDSLSDKVEHLSERVEKIELDLHYVHEEVHKQDVQLAVLESARDNNEYIESKRRASRRS